MELALDVIDGNMTYAIDYKFQSLFSWNLLLMSTRHYYGGNRREVSILVFVELALDEKPGGTSPPPYSEVSILVFVELALDDLISMKVQTKN